MQLNENETFNFYLKFAKPLVLTLARAEDRAKAAAWVRKLCNISASDGSDLRTDYIKLLLFVLQRRHLVGPFAAAPDPDAPLEPFPPHYKLLDVAKALIEAEEELLEENRKAGAGDWPAFTTECSADLLEYAASQKIPNFGIHAFYAISKIPIPKWDNIDKGVLPKGAVSAVEKSLLSPILPASFSSTSEPEITKFTAPRAPQPGDKTGIRVKSPIRRRKVCPSARRTATAAEPEVRIQPRPQDSPYGLSPPPERDRAPPTWGSNLIDVHDAPQAKSRRIFEEDDVEERPVERDRTSPLGRFLREGAEGIPALEQWTKNVEEIFDLGDISAITPDDYEKSHVLDTPPMFSRDPNVRGRTRTYEPKEFEVDEAEQWVEGSQFFKDKLQFSPFKDPRMVDRREPPSPTLSYIQPDPGELYSLLDISDLDLDAVDDILYSPEYPELILPPVSPPSPQFPPTHSQYYSALDETSEPELYFTPDITPEQVQAESSKSVEVVYETPKYKEVVMPPSSPPSPEISTRERIEMENAEKSRIFFEEMEKQYAEDIGDSPVSYNLPLTTPRRPAFPCPAIEFPPRYSPELEDEEPPEFYESPPPSPTEIMEAQAQWSPIIPPPRPFQYYSPGEVTPPPYTPELDEISEPDLYITPSSVDSSPYQSYFSELSTPPTGPMLADISQPELYWSPIPVSPETPPEQRQAFFEMIKGYVPERQGSWKKKHMYRSRLKAIAEMPEKSPPARPLPPEVSPPHIIMTRNRLLWDSRGPERSVPRGAMKRMQNILAATALPPGLDKPGRKPGTPISPKSIPSKKKTFERHEAKIVESDKGIEATKKSTELVTQEIPEEEIEIDKPPSPRHVLDTTPPRSLPPPLLPPYFGYTTPPELKTPYRSPPKLPIPGRPSPKPIYYPTDYIGAESPPSNFASPESRYTPTPPRYSPGLDEISPVDLYESPEVIPSDSPESPATPPNLIQTIRDWQVKAQRSWENKHRQFRKLSPVMEAAQEEPPPSRRLRERVAPMTPRRLHPVLYPTKPPDSARMARMIDDHGIPEVRREIPGPRRIDPEEYGLSPPITETPKGRYGGRGRGRRRRIVHTATPRNLLYQIEEAQLNISPERRQSATQVQTTVQDPEGHMTSALSTEVETSGLIEGPPVTPVHEKTSVLKTTSFAYETPPELKKSAYIFGESPPSDMSEADVYLTPSPPPRTPPRYTPTLDEITPPAFYVSPPPRLTPTPPRYTPTLEEISPPVFYRTPPRTPSRRSPTLDEITRPVFYVSPRSPRRTPTPPRGFLEDISPPVFYVSPRPPRRRTPTPPRRFLEETSPPVFYVSPKSPRRRTPTPPRYSPQGYYMPQERVPASYVAARTRRRMTPTPPKYRPISPPAFYASPESVTPTPPRLTEVSPPAFYESLSEAGDLSYLQTSRMSLTADSSDDWETIEVEEVSAEYTPEKAPVPVVVRPSRSRHVLDTTPPPTLPPPLLHPYLDYKTPPHLKIPYQELPDLPTPGQAPVRPVYYPTDYIGAESPPSDMSSLVSPVHTPTPPPYYPPGILEDSPPELYHSPENLSPPSPRFVQQFYFTPPTPPEQTRQFLESVRQHVVPLTRSWEKKHLHRPRLPTILESAAPEPEDFGLPPVQLYKRRGYDPRFDPEYYGLSPPKHPRYSPYASRVVKTKSVEEVVEVEPSDQVKTTTERRVVVEHVTPPPPTPTLSPPGLASPDSTPDLVTSASPEKRVAYEYVTPPELKKSAYIFGESPPSGMEESFEYVTPPRPGRVIPIPPRYYSNLAEVSPPVLYRSTDSTPSFISSRSPSPRVRFTPTPPRLTPTLGEISPPSMYVSPERPKGWYSPSALLSPETPPEVRRRVMERLQAYQPTDEGSWKKKHVFKGKLQAIPESPELRYRPEVQISPLVPRPPVARRLRFDRTPPRLKDIIKTKQVVVETESEVDLTPPPPPRHILDESLPPGLPSPLLHPYLGYTTPPHLKGRYHPVPRLQSPFFPSPRPVMYPTDYIGAESPPSEIFDIESPRTPPPRISPLRPTRAPTPVSTPTPVITSPETLTPPPYYGPGLMEESPPDVYGSTVFYLDSPPEVSSWRRVPVQQRTDTPPTPPEVIDQFVQSVRDYERSVLKSWEKKHQKRPKLQTIPEQATPPPTPPPPPSPEYFDHGIPVFQRQVYRPRYFDPRDYGLSPDPEEEVYSPKYQVMELPKFSPKRLEFEDDSEEVIELEDSGQPGEIVETTAVQTTQETGWPAEIMGEDYQMLEDEPPVELWAEPYSPPLPPMTASPDVSPSGGGRAFAEGYEYEREEGERGFRWLGPTT